MYDGFMEWLNYHHLYYFWTVAKEGSIAAACEKLHLAQPTISGQLRRLEESLGEKLFTKSGRSLVLTDTGQVVSAETPRTLRCGNVNRCARSADVAMPW